jgi:hypothetical protein
MIGMPVAKSKDFRGAFRRLLGTLRPEAARIVVVLVLAVGSVTFAIIGPKLLGEATNIIYEGVGGRQFPAGVTQEQIGLGRRARRSSRTCSPRCTSRPAAASGCCPRPGPPGPAPYPTTRSPDAGGSIMAGVTQRIHHSRHRRRVARLPPPRYFDGHLRGDV